MLVLTFSQTPVSYNHLADKYALQLNELITWLTNHFPEHNRATIKVCDYASTEFFDRVYALHDLLKDYPEPLPEFQEIDFGVNHYQHLINHRSLRAIDLEIRRSGILYRLDTSSYWEKIDKKEFTLSFFTDLVYSYMDNHAHNPDFVSQLQVHQYVVLRYSGPACIEDCFDYLNRYNY
jgi:hypothetical protein